MHVWKQPKSSYLKFGLFVVLAYISKLWKVKTETLEGYRLVFTDSVSYTLAHDDKKP